MADDVDKLVNYLQQRVKDALAGNLGQKATPDRVVAMNTAINVALEKATGHSGILVDTEIMGDALRFKLQQPSYLDQILPKLKGPFVPWAENGVVHLAGKLGDYTVRVCDYAMLLIGGYGCATQMVSCLGCLTFVPPRTKSSTDTAT